MKSPRVSAYLGALLAVVVAQAAAPPFVMAHEQARSEYGAGLRLTSFPARVRLLGPVPGSSLSNGGKDALARAMKTWSDVEGSPLRYEMAGEDGPAIVEVKPISEGWAWGEAIGAHTDVKSDAFTGEIQHVVIEIDAKRKWSDSPDVPADAIDLETVLLHELGHAAGLAHSWDPSAVMRAGIKPGQTPRRALTKDDKDGIVAVYSKKEIPSADKPKAEKPLPSSRWPHPVAAIALLIGSILTIRWIRKKQR